MPDNAALQLHAFTDEANATKLKKGQTGYVAPTSSPRSRLNVEIAKVASHPAVDGKYPVSLKVSGKPDGLHLVPGMKGKVKITTGDEGDSLAIPTKALHEETDGSYTVKVKGKDGKENKTAVTVGAESNGQIVVLSGLKEGQVIVTPDAPAKPEAKK